jgi:zinc protease
MKKIIISILFIFCCAPLSAGQTSFWKGINKVKLENGLTVLMKEDHSQPLVTAQVWVKAGSVYENPKTYGLSHFLEHLIFKGTEKYPGDAISRKVETQGGAINAATSKEFTEFYIDIQKGAAEDAVRILADAMANASFPPDELERERLVVLEEMRRHEDDPGGLLYDMLEEVVYLKSPYRSRVLGSVEIIRNVSRQEIMDYYHAYYVPNNMVFALIGDFDTNKMTLLIKDTFGGMKSKPVPAEPALIEPPHAPVSSSKNKDVEHTYWVGAFLGPSIKDTKDQYTADVISTLIGGGRSSRLNRKLREEKQLVYSISASFWTMRGSGMMVFSAAIPPGKEKPAIDATLAEIELLKDKGPEENELNRVKEMAKSSWYFGLETCHGQASLASYWYLLGNPGYIDNYVKGIESVTSEDVVNFMKKYYGNGLNQAIMLPEKK